MNDQAPTPDIIDRLIHDLTSVQRLRSRSLVAGISVLAATAVMAMAATLHLRADITDGHPSLLLGTRSLLLLALGASSLATLMTEAIPGREHRAFLTPSALGSAVFVTLAAVSLARNGVPTELPDRSALLCLSVSTTTSAVFATAMTLWLRKAAPINPWRTGWLTGLSAGALGTFVYNLHCPTTTIAYAAVWYGSAIVVSTTLGRLLVPRFVRW